MDREIEGEEVGLSVCYSNTGSNSPASSPPCTVLPPLRRLSRVDARPPAWTSSRRRWRALGRRPRLFKPHRSPISPFLLPSFLCLPPWPSSRARAAAAPPSLRRTPATRAPSPSSLSAARARPLSSPRSCCCCSWPCPPWQTSKAPPHAWSGHHRLRLAEPPPPPPPHSSSRAAPPALPLGPRRPSRLAQSRGRRCTWLERCRPPAAVVQPLEGAPGSGQAAALPPRRLR
jgi:hypothetical protein